MKKFLIALAILFPLPAMAITLDISGDTQIIDLVNGATQLAHITIGQPIINVCNQNFNNDFSNPCDLILGAVHL